MVFFTPTKVLRSFDTYAEDFHRVGADAPFRKHAAILTLSSSSLGIAAGLWSQPIRPHRTAFELLTNFNLIARYGTGTVPRRSTSDCVSVKGGFCLIFSFLRVVTYLYIWAFWPFSDCLFPPKCSRLVKWTKFIGRSFHLYVYGKITEQYPLHLTIACPLCRQSERHQSHDPCKQRWRVPLPILVETAWQTPLQTSPKNRAFSSTFSQATPHFRIFQDILQFVKHPLLTFNVM